MSTATVTLPAPSVKAPNMLGVLLTEVRYEFVRSARTRAFTISTLGFPVILYCMFGLLLNRSVIVHGAPLTKILLATYAVFGGFGTALFGIGIGLAGDLSAGWLELKRASPMPPMAYLLAKCCTAMAFSVIIVCLLSVIGISFGHVSITGADFAKMIGLAMVGAIPFAAMGLALALTVPFNSAPGVAQLFYLPMSFLGGLWVPLSILPKPVQTIGHVMPTYHMGQLMLRTFGYQDSSSVLSHCLGLAIFTALMLGVAWMAFRRREQNS